MAGNRGENQQQDLARLKEALSADAFNRLVRSVSATRQKGRLQYWQERLLARAAAEAGVAIEGVDHFLTLFEGAAEKPTPKSPVTREEFLQRMAHRPFDLPMTPDEVPAAWMADAWGVRAVRDQLTADMARTVSKIGELAYRDDYLRLLARSLSDRDLIELFRRIRDESPHREVEFRPGFERVFQTPPRPCPRR